VIQGFDFTDPPALVVQADWSINPGKRWMAIPNSQGTIIWFSPQSWSATYRIS